RDTARGRRAVAVGAAVLVAAALGVGAAVHLPEEIEIVTYEAQLRDELPEAVTQAGGAQRLLACGDVAVNPLLVPWVAWELEVHARRIGLTTRGPGTVLRARHRPGKAALPAPGMLAGVPGSELVARTPLWEVVGTCPR
ncbi:MAG: hypothetical protein M3459_07235, partial [Actinomycetota bacterium]|nr:hypothetical protein [Actinomycetota bacterium]